MFMILFRTEKTIGVLFVRAWLFSAAFVESHVCNQVVRLEEDYAIESKTRGQVTS
jgi:hypothetical protein